MGAGSRTRFPRAWDQQRMGTDKRMTEGRRDRLRAGEASGQRRPLERRWRFRERRFFALHPPSSPPRSAQNDNEVASVGSGWDFDDTRGAILGAEVLRPPLPLLPAPLC